MALVNIVGGSTIQRRWLMACGFGLVHGFGFSFALREQLQLAGSHLLSSLLAFNVGVELGQLLVLVILIPLLNFGFRYVVAERLGTIIMSVLVAHTGWHWMTERFDQLRQFQFDWPTISAGVVTAMSWLVLIAAVLRVLGLIFAVVRKRFAQMPEHTRVP
jgi:hypothetical protein